jgi:hypothetical protein
MAPLKLPSLRRLHATGLQMYLRIPEAVSSKLKDLYDTTTGFLSPFPQRLGQSYLLGIISRYPDEEQFRARILLSRDAPLGALREAIAESGGRGAISRRDPEWDEFIEALHAATLDGALQGHCHAQFEYDMDQFESRISLPSKPMLVDTAFNEISGYHLINRDSDNSVQTELIVDVIRSPLLDHEVIFSCTLDPSKDLLRGALEQGAEISRKQIRRRQKND